VYTFYHAEILPVHYTWKVAEKGFKMASMMNKFAMIYSCEIQVRTILVCTLYSIKYGNYNSAFLHHFMTFNVLTQVKDKCISDPAYEEVNNAFERALVFMHKMPRVWMDYCTFLVSQRLITRCPCHKTF
jgi:hypothetical protein